MKKVVFVLCALALFACEDKKEVKSFSAVTVKDIYTEKVSIRAIDVLDGSLGFHPGSTVKDIDCLRFLLLGLCHRI